MVDSFPKTAATRYRTTVSDTERGLESDLLVQLYQQAYPLVFGFPLASLIIAFFLWEPVPHRLLLPWILVILAISLGRHQLTKAFFKDPAVDAHRRRWTGGYVLLELAAGAAAGMSGLFFEFVPFEYQVLLVFVIVVEAAGGAALLSPVLTVYLAFLFPGIGIVTYWFLQQGPDAPFLMALLLPIYAGLMVGVAYSLNRSIADSLNLRYRNTHLIARLAESNEELQQARDEAEQAQEIVSREKDFAESIIDTAQAIILLLDSQGKIVRFNPYMETLSGYRLAEVQGKDWFATFLDVRDISRMHEVFDETVKEGSSRGKVNAILTRDGDERIIEWYNKPLKGKDGTLTAVLAIGHDITERQGAEAALRLSKEQAEQANAAKSLFLANMSHEIRTPMNGIVTMTRVLLDTDLDERQRGYADIVLNSTENLVRILDDILDLAKIESGTLEIVDGDFSLNGLAEHCRGLFQPLSEQKGLTFEQDSDLPPDLNWVRGDRARLIQVTSNLVGNAIKFTDRGGILCRMTAHDVDEDRVLLNIEVKDSGPGIAESEQERIFDRFVQLSEGFDKRYGGTGLGLTVCRSLVTKMGGSIGVDSTIGEGSRFYFEVQLKKARAVARQSEPISALPDPQKHPVLIVDDDKVAAMGAKLLLENLGIPVTTVNDGGQALQIIRQTPFDAILMDVHMPEMDGMEVTRRIRQDADERIARVPIIGVTASVLKNERQMYLESGMDHVLAKPVELDALMNLLVSMLAGNSRATSNASK